MSTQTTQPFRVAERTSAIYTATLKDPADVVVPGSVLTLGTLTLSDVSTGTILNNRAAQDILNLNDVTITEGGLLTWILQPADNAIIGTRQLERHSALFRLQWISGGQTKQLDWEVILLVTNFATETAGPLPILLATLPTSDPHVVTAVWNNLGTPVVSAG
jgi:hypothetical protein